MPSPQELAANPQLDEATLVAVEKKSVRTLLAEADTTKEKITALLTWYKATRLGRALARLTSAGGFLLAGGVAYAGLFSVFSALAIGWTIFMAVLGNNQSLRDSVIESINTALPGILTTDDKQGLVDPDQLVQSTALNLTSIIALGVLLWSALAVMTALRTSIQRMFGVIGPPENFAIGKLKDLTGFIVIGLAIVVTSVLGIAAGTFGKTVLDWLGVEGAIAGFLLRVASFALAAVVDFGVFIYLFRFVAGMRAPRRDLFMGAGIAAVASGILRVLGTSAVGSVTDNPILASAAALITLLLWINLLVRVTLVAAAFTANPPAPLMPQTPEELRFDQSPNYVTVSVPETLQWDHQAITGALNPDPSLDPHYRDEDEHPYWGGLIGWYKRRKVQRLERKLERARADYMRPVT